MKRLIDAALVAGAATFVVIAIGLIVGITGALIFLAAGAPWN